MPDTFERSNAGAVQSTCEADDDRIAVAVSPRQGHVDRRSPESRAADEPIERLRIRAEHHREARPGTGADVELAVEHAHESLLVDRAGPAAEDGVHGADEDLGLGAAIDLHEGRAGMTGADDSGVILGLGGADGRDRGQDEADGGDDDNQATQTVHWAILGTTAPCWAGVGLA